MNVTNRIDKRVAAVIAAIVLAVLGAVSMLVYANDARDKAFEGAETIAVYQVKDNIPAGTSASDLGNRIELVKLPRAGLAASALGSLDTVQNKVTTTDLVVGEVLLEGRFSDSAAGKGAIEVPKGLQELTISLPTVRVIGGTLKQGQHVGVIATYVDLKRSNLVDNRILVLGVSQAAVADAAEDGDGQKVAVRLAVSSENSTKIVNAMEVGKVWLVRQGADATADRRQISPEDVLK